MKEWGNSVKGLSSFHTQILGGKQNKNVCGLNGYPRPETDTSLWWFEGYPFIPLSCIRVWMSHWEGAAADAVPMRFLESTWPLFASADEHLDNVSEQQAWHWNFCDVRFDVRLRLRSRGPAKSYFSHFLLVSQSSSREGGHLLTIRKTEALNSASHPQWKVGSEPWCPKVPREVRASSFPPSVKNVARPQRRQRKQTKLSNLLAGP